MMPIVKTIELAEPRGWAGSKARFNPRIVFSLRSSSKVVSAVVTLVGSLTLVSWMLDVTTLKTAPNLIEASTTLASILAGISLWVLQNKQDRQARKSPGWRIGQLCAVAVAATGLSTLVGYLFSWQSFLFKEYLTATEMFQHDRITPSIALSFLLLGSSLLLMDVKVARYHPGEWLALIALILAVLAIMGYAYEV